jgi:hypothetical protein
MASEEEPDADSTDDDESRSQGIELGDLDEKLESHDYPTTATTLVDEYGDHEISLPGGSQRVEEVLGLYEEDDQEFTDAEEVRQAIHNLVGAEAVGRDHYSDRGGSTPDEGGENEDESF